MTYECVSYLDPIKYFIKTFWNLNNRSKPITLKSESAFMKKIVALVLFFAVASVSEAQMVEGKVTYNRKVDWISIMENLPYMTKEEIDRNRLTWGSRDSKGRNYLLEFKNDKSLYTYKEEESEGGYSRSKEKYIIVRDYQANQTNDWREFLGKKYRIQEEIPKHRWKILNEIREIDGYLCMKAETKDTIKDQVIHAWFADGIPFSGGPEGFGGLPGLILELDINDGEVLITATDVSGDSWDGKLSIPKKMKGKEITYAELDEKTKSYIDDSIEGKKNPYWRIRY